MTDIIKKEAESVTLEDLVLIIHLNHDWFFIWKVKKFIPESIGKEIERQTQGIYPLQNVLIRKVASQLNYRSSNASLNFFNLSFFFVCEGEDA